MASKNILVVEDVQMQNDEICEIVREQGYNPIPALSGKEGFDVLKKHRRGFGILTPDIGCVLLDINLGDMSGLEWLELIRRKENQSHFKRQLPVIILTAHGEKENRDIASHPYTGMACSFIEKPLKRKKVVDTLIRVMEGKEAEIMRDIFRESTY